MTTTPTTSTTSTPTTRHTAPVTLRTLELLTPLVGPRVLTVTLALAPGVDALVVQRRVLELVTSLSSSPEDLP